MCVSKQVCTSVLAPYTVGEVDYTNTVIPSNTSYNHTEHHIINLFPYYQALMHLRTTWDSLAVPGPPVHAQPSSQLPIYVKRFLRTHRQLEKPTDSTSQPGTEKHRSSFEFQGASEYNPLPQNIRCISNLQSRC